MILFSKLPTFKGGLHPHDNKHFTKNAETIIMKPPKTVYIPLQQHIGAPARACVKKGDNVYLGQKIADAGGFVSTPIHSSVSGTVKKIEPVPHALGGHVMSIIIDNDGQDTIDPSIKEYENNPRDINNITKEEIKKLVMDSGIVGMGGATFPTHVKLSPPPDTKIDLLVVNGAECEPYLTSDYRLMLEQSEKIFKGMIAAMKVLGASNGVIGIEDNKKDAYEVLNEFTKIYPSIKVTLVRTRYPQGSEKHLIYAVSKRKVPNGALPMAVGTAVINVSTAAAISDMVEFNKPLYERYVTISGQAVAKPGNFLVRIGTLLDDLIKECGGLTTEATKVLLGGPMMGIAQQRTDVPVIKGSSGFLFLTEKESSKIDENPCLRCGKCYYACPMGLLPGEISTAYRYGDLEQAEKLGALNCIECGICSYTCPSGQDLVQSIRAAKTKIMLERKKKAAEKSKDE